MRSMIPVRVTVNYDHPEWLLFRLVDGDPAFTFLQSTMLESFASVAVAKQSPSNVSLCLLIKKSEKNKGIR